MALDAATMDRFRATFGIPSAHCVKHAFPAGTGLFGTCFVPRPQQVIERVVARIGREACRVTHRNGSFIMMEASRLRARVNNL